MDKRLRLTGSLLALLALVAASGGHWLVLQSIAWTQMVAKYSRDGSLTSAIALTFDGEHPCDLCVKVQDGSTREQRDHEQSPSVTVEHGPDIFCDDSASECLLLALKTDAPPRPAKLSFVELAYPPPTPPPRMVVSGLGRQSPTCYLLSPICHLPSATCYLPSATCHLLSPICHLPSATCFLRAPSSEFPSPSLRFAAVDSRNVPAPALAVRLRSNTRLSFVSGITPIMRTDIITFGCLLNAGVGRLHQPYCSASSLVTV